MKYALLALALFSAAAQAQSTTPLDLNTMDQKVVKDFLSAWEIQNEDGTKKCRVRLSREETIGGMVIDVAKGCDKTFPVMADVASWRIYQDWEIVLADATHKGLIRFYTPDNEYVADPETDGISTIRKKK